MATADITLSLARLEDAETIARMSRDLIETGLGWEYRPQKIAGFIVDRNAITLVANDGPRCAGFAVMTFGHERAHLVLLAVHPRYRRRGVGSRMLAWLLESARTAGVASVHLELLDDNAAARAFYRALGFAETMRLPGYYRGRKAALRMILVLRVPGASVPAWVAPPR